MAMHYRLNQISFLQNCICSARSFSDGHYDTYVLKLRREDIVNDAFTLAELKLALDPFDDFSLVQHLAKEVDEHINDFRAQPSSQ